MARQRGTAAIVLVAALVGCAELTAEEPLFSPADQIGPPPLTEGVWIALHEDCPARNARRRTGRFPADCMPLELRRLEDGAWRMRLRIDLMSNLSAQERTEAESEYAPARAVIAPAVEHPPADGYASLYVAELSPHSEDDAISYAVIAPIGLMPATSAIIITPVSCFDILRDGPIEGVTAQYTTTEESAPVLEGDAIVDPPLASEPQPAAEPQLSGCVATTQAGVREAARRAVLENLGEMLERRYVYVRPQ